MLLNGSEYLDDIFRIATYEIIAETKSNDLNQSQVYGFRLFHIQTE